MTIASPQASAAAGARPLSCYLVEDNPLIRENLGAALEEMAPVRVIGYADSLGSARTWLSCGHECRLMIIDIFLRSGTGLEVLGLARSLSSSARLVVLTNYATAAMRDRCLSLGADRVFDKSRELEELLMYCKDLAESQ